jgi:hypothetical protein
MGLYVYDASGNQELVYRDPDISSMYPIPLRARPKPPVLPNTVDWELAPHGRFLLQDVYLGLKGIKRGTVKSLRIVGVTPKVQPHMNNPVVGVSLEDPGKFVLGTVPVEADGSACFHVPSGLSVFFQALDEQGLALQTMRSLTYVQPGQTLSCIGCHEHRDLAPAVAPVPIAAERPPSRLRPGPNGSWPLRFDELVQPVLDRYCVTCHRAESEDPTAAQFVLTPPDSYDSLLSYSNEDLKQLALEKDQSFVGDMPARKSKLLALLTDANGHEGVRLDADAYERLVTWMDTYANIQGSFSPEQEEELRRLRDELRDLLVSVAEP